MVDPASPDHILASPDHAPALPDYILGSPELVVASPDHVFAFPEDNLVLDIEEDLEEDQEMDLEDEDDKWEDDWLMASVTPPKAALLTRLDTPPLPSSTSTPLPINPVMLPDYQTTTSDTIPSIPSTLHRFQQERDHVHSTFEVGVPYLHKHLMHQSIWGRPFSVVASRVALHHQDLRTLHVIIDSAESIQTGLRRSEREIERDIRWLGKHYDVIEARTLSLMTATEERVQSLSQDVEYMQDVLDVAKTEVFELRYRVDAYPRKQVDTLRVKDARAEIQDLQTRLSTSERCEMSLITRLLRMEVRISALEQRPSGQLGTPDSSRFNLNDSFVLMIDHAAKKDESSCHWKLTLLSRGLRPLLNIGKIEATTADSWSCWELE
ncbi:hypothetical protein Tco_0551260 [Tanacetum coccineum]